MPNRKLFTVAIVALFALPAVPAAHAEAAPAHATAPITDAQFDSAFSAHAALPPAPEPAAGAVDLDSFDPPVEAEQPATAIGSGVASYYGAKFHGRRTASGERFDMHAMTAAHRTLPFGTKLRVTNPGNGKSVIVRINDRGPFHGNRMIDLSRAAATQLGLIARGSGKVELARLD